MTCNTASLQAIYATMLSSFIMAVLSADLQVASHHSLELQSLQALHWTQTQVQAGGVLLYAASLC